MNQITDEDVTAAVTRLSGATATPLCSAHNPIAESVQVEGGWTVRVHCKACGYTALIHPQAWEEMSA